MIELYVLAKFDSEGNFERYVRKGRNNTISGYDNLTGAKRGLTHSRSNLSEERKRLIKIVKVNSLEVIE